MNPPEAAPVVGFVAKDPWEPAIRREHMIAAALAVRGIEVRFVEAPADVRRLPGAARSWAGQLSRADFRPVAPGISVTGRSTFVPGHRNALAEALDRGLLGGFLRRAGWDPAVSVFMLPWDWGAQPAGAGRRVFDCTDDWGRLLPHRAPQIREQLRRVGDEADEIIVVNAVLGELFPGRTPVVVPNGTARDLLDAPDGGKRRPRHAVYVGSISERFDVDLVRAVMGALPDWTLDVFGQLVFGRRQRAEVERFQALEPWSGGRIRYRGLLPRTRLAEVLDSATVALLPNDPARALGQSSMKIYDYCARGLPIVTTAGHLEHSSDLPPHVAVVTGAEQMVAAMVAAEDEPAELATERRAWAAASTWERRTDLWLDAALGGTGRVEP